MGIKAHVICHTHWDREWYYTREQFRTKLIRLIDGLLEVVETVPDYVSFMLDGQTIILEDYLEIKPYNRERLYRAMCAGKIVCGPWYILPDELLISGESHLRNYLIGSKVSEEAGVKKMKTAYLPDSFGHPCQMPQIVEGLGMDTMVFWRGVPEAVDKTEFYWESPCEGKKVFCVHLPNGYGNSGNLSADMEETVPRMENLIESLGARATTDVILLMNGSDHITGQKDITQIIRELGKRLPQYQIELSTMEAFLRELKPKLPPLKTYHGEFRSSERSMLLGGTLSTRMPLKQSNERVQTAMERYLEPILSGERLIGGTEDIRGYSDYLWKKILENHPHDSICGCSIDPVHREMETRFACVSQLENLLLDDAVRRLESLTRTEKAADGVCLSLFEPSQDGCPSYLEAEIDLDRMLVQEVNFTRSIIEDYEDRIQHPDCPQGVRVHDEQGREIPCFVIRSGKGYVTRYQDRTLPEIDKTNHLRIGMLLPAFSYGFHELSVVRAERGPEISTNAEPVVENEFYRLTVENGAFTVEDKKSGRVHKGVGRFLDKGDAGDEYTYSWPAEDRTCTLSEEGLRVYAEDLGGLGGRLVLEGVLKLPKALESDRKRRAGETVDCPVRVEAMLMRGIDRIDFHTELENNACDHRLQVQFPSGTNADVSESSDVFSVTRRPVDFTVPEQWAEYPQSTFPTHGFLNLEDGSCGLCAAAKGLTEAEAVRENGQTMLNLTLLRCVGWLSRTDLLTRDGNGGWTIETPEAQCLGKHTFDYSIAYHAGDWRTEKVFGKMEKFRLPARIQQFESGTRTALADGNPLAWVSALPENLRLSALKPAEEGEGLILRFYEAEGKDTAFSFPLPKGIVSVCRVNLAEEGAVPLPVEKGTVSLTAAAHEIVSLKLLTR